MTFGVGRPVASRHDPTWAGAVSAVLPADSKGLQRYRVFHGPGVSREHSEDQLIAAPADRSGFAALRPRLFTYLHEVRSRPCLKPGHSFRRFQVDLLDHMSDRVSLRVTGVDAPPGTYLFAVYTWRTRGIIQESHVAEFAVDLATLDPSEAVERRMIGLLAHADTAADANPAVVTREARQALRSRREDRRRVLLAGATETDQEVAVRRLTRLAARQARHAHLAAARLAAEPDAEAASLLASERERVDNAFEQARRAYEERGAVELISRSVAKGTLIVGRPQRS
jgi:hypothetical protein